MTQNAIAAISRLAEVYEEGLQLSSQEIADNRGLAQTLVAKLLSNLSQAGLVVGTRGPGGGYSLAKPPQEIRLIDIVSIFEREGEQIHCPFGPNWCGEKEPCPLHEHYVTIIDQFNDWLENTDLTVFGKR